MIALKLLFWGSAAALAWTHAGYPAAAILAARARSAVASAPGSAPPSTATISSSRSRGHCSASAFSTLAAITASSR